jgi:glycosyltransferase involved in cell wall biosynthesis
LGGTSLKVVHIITGLCTGGAERALYNLLQGGLNKDFDSIVISLSDKGTLGAKIEALGVPVFALGMPVGRPTLGSIIKLRQLIKKLQPDLIQGWMYHGNLVATLAKFFSSKNVALVWNVRHSLYHIEDEKKLTQLVIKANRFFSKSVDTLLYNSQVSRQHHEEFGFSAKHGLVVPNGINCQQFCFSVEARQRIRTELAIPSKALVIGHIARFHPIKDHAIFLQAAVDVAKKHPNAYFLLSGRGVCLKNTEVTQRIPSSLQHRFHFLGERTDVADLMSCMDILCSSSRGEAFPNVLGEAMATGIPCVATDVGDSALIISDTGVVVSPRNEVALADGIEKLLALDKIELQELGLKARSHIVDNFALKTIVEQYSNLYKVLVQWS